MAPRRFDDSDLTVMLCPSQCTDTGSGIHCYNHTASHIDAGAGSCYVHTADADAGQYMAGCVSSWSHPCFLLRRARNIMPNYPHNRVCDLHAYTALDLCVYLQLSGFTDAVRHAGRYRIRHLLPRLMYRLTCRPRVCRSFRPTCPSTNHQTRRLRQRQWQCTGYSLIPYMSCRLVKYAWLSHTGNRSHHLIHYTA